jgi:thioredoxin 1
MAGNNTKVFTDANFEQEVLKADRPVLVDFWAEWCAPCRMMSPTVESVAEQYSDRAKVGKLNVDDSPSVAGRYNIRGIPTLLLFKNGEVQEQVVGATSKDAILKMLEKYL